MGTDHGKSWACAAVAWSRPELAAHSRRLACWLDLPVLPDGPSNAVFLLTVQDDRLVLQDTRRRSRPVWVDFTGGATNYRRRHGGGRRQPLGRAAGLKPGYRPDVLDATAGLGTDAFVLAGLGCRVRMLERSPVAAALLADGLRRARADPAVGTRLAGRMRLERADAIGFLLARPAAADAEDVVYLDPMYPHRRKSALPGKEMQLFRELVGDDEDAPHLLAAALRYARRRVVVKRPSRAAPLVGPPPDLHIDSRQTRYDVYLVDRRVAAGPRTATGVTT